MGHEGRNVLDDDVRSGVVSCHALLISDHSKMMAGFTIVLPSPIAGNKKPTVKVGFLRDNLVGTRGFEPPTPDTP